MNKELVIIYDGPDLSSEHIISVHNVTYYKNFFSKIHILYWSKDKNVGMQKREGESLTFYPYSQPYNSGYITGLKFMIWIAKTLLKICNSAKKETKLIFMPVIPIWAGLPSLIVAKLKRKKIVLRLEAQKIDYTEREARLAGSSKLSVFLKLLFLKIIYRFTLPFYDMVVGISKGISDEARNYGAKKTITIPIANIKPFFFEKKKEFGNEKPIILYVGQIKKTKGVHLLIEAVKKIQNESKYDVKILAAGRVTNPKDNDFQNGLQEMGKSLDLEFLGWVPHKELPEIYEEADIFVLPSYSEALGMVIMEAMASGLPVIATKTSGAEYLVEHGKTGYLVPIGDVDELKNKIKILLENSDLRKKMGEAGRERVIKIMKKADENNKKLWKTL